MGEVGKARASLEDVSCEMELPREGKDVGKLDGPRGEMGDGARDAAQDKAAGDEENHAAARDAGIGRVPAEEEREHPDVEDEKNLECEK